MALNVHIYGLPSERARDGQLAYLISGEHGPIFRGACQDISSLVLDLHALKVFTINPAYEPPHESLYREPGAHVLDERVTKEIESVRTGQLTSF